MASRMIFDSPALLDETLLSLTAACKEFPGRCSRPTLERWARKKGSRGATLETILLCGRRYTSREAIDRFVRSQLQTEAARPAPTREMSKKDITTRARRLGLPEPIETRQEG